MTFVSKIYIILLLIMALNRDVCNDSSLVLTSHFRNIYIR